MFIKHQDQILKMHKVNKTYVTKILPESDSGFCSFQFVKSSRTFGGEVFKLSFFYKANDTTGEQCAAICVWSPASACN